MARSWQLEIEQFIRGNPQLVVLPARPTTAYSLQTILHKLGRQRKFYTERELRDSGGAARQKQGLDDLFAKGMVLAIGNVRWMLVPEQDSYDIFKIDFENVRYIHQEEMLAGHLNDPKRARSRQLLIGAGREFVEILYRLLYDRLLHETPPKAMPAAGMRTQPTLLDKRTSSRRRVSLSESDSATGSRSSSVDLSGSLSDEFPDWPFDIPLVTGAGGGLHLFKGWAYKGGRAQRLLGSGGVDTLKRLQKGSLVIFAETGLESRVVTLLHSDRTQLLGGLLASLRGEPENLPLLEGFTPQALEDFGRLAIESLVEAIRDIAPAYRYLLRGTLGLQAQPGDDEAFRERLEDLELYLHIDKLLEFARDGGAKVRYALLGIVAWVHRHDKVGVDTRTPWLTINSLAVPLSHLVLKHPFTDDDGIDELVQAAFGVAPRKLQRDAIRDVLTKQGTHLVVMPTGSGKTFVYWAAAKLHRSQFHGSTVVISPLLSLIHDQVRQAQQYFEHNEVAYLDGSLSAQQRLQILDRYARGAIGLLYLTPEQLVRRETQTALEAFLPNLWVFDEAHTLVEWGASFRPAYLQSVGVVGEIARLQPQIVLATATSTRDEKEHLRELFEAFGDFHETVFVVGLPDTITIEIAPWEDAGKQLRRIVDEVQAVVERNEQAIVYCLTPAQAQRFQVDLQDYLAGVGVGCYHGRLTSDERRDQESAFTTNRIQVMVATEAFGLGLDHPGVRLVIHAQPPSGIEAYVQQIGRATRTEHPARSLMLCNPEEIETLFHLQAAQLLKRDDYRAVFLALRELGKTMKTTDEDSATLWLTPQDLAQLARLDDTGNTAALRVELALHRLEQLGVIDLEARQAGRIDIQPDKLALREANNLSLDAQILTDMLLRENSHVESISDLMLATNMSAFGCLEALGELARVGAATFDFDVLVHFNKGTRFGALRASVARLFQLEEAARKAIQERASDGRDDHEESYRVSLVELLGVMTDQLDEELLSWNDAQLAVRLWAALGWVSWALENQQVELKLHKPAEHSWFHRAEQFVPLLRKGMEVLVDDLYDQVRGVGRSVSAMVEVASLQGSMPEGISLARLLGTLHRLNFMMVSGGAELQGSSHPITYLADHKVTLRNLDYGELRQENHRRYAKLHLLEHLLAARSETAAKIVMRDYFSTASTELFERHFGDRMPEPLPCRLADYQRIMDLSDQQAKIVGAQQKALLVVAGPGSGKTRVIVSRVAYLVRIQRVPADRILVVAFNRSAANEVRRRLRSFLGMQGSMVSVKTFHSLALEILGMDLRTLAESTHRDTEEALKDVIEHALVTLRNETSESGEEEARLQGYAGRYDYVLVDEYQDINHDQYTLIRILVGHGQGEDGERTLYNIWGVGDDDQTLYEFQGADPQFLHNFERDYETTRLALVDNYRSVGNIVAYANHLIGRSQQRQKSGADEQVRSVRHSGDKVVRYDYRNAVDLYHFVIGEVHALVDQGVPVQEIAVLAPRWQTLVPLWALMREMGIPVRLLKGNKFLPPTQSHPWRSLLPELAGRNGQAANVSIEAITREALGRLGAGTYAPSIQRALHIARELDDERRSAGLFEREVNIRAMISQFKVDVFQFSEAGKAADQATLSTFHSAKGLEYQAVFIIGDTPHQRADPEQDLRKYYVGATRAKDRLYILNPPFILNELPTEFTTRVDGPQRRLGMPDKATIEVTLDQFGDVYLDDAHTKQLHTQDLLREAHLNDEPLPLRVDKHELSYGHSRFVFYCANHGNAVGRIGSASKRKSGEILTMLPGAHFERVEGQLLEGSYFAKEDREHLVPIVQLQFRARFPRL